MQFLNLPEVYQLPAQFRCWCSFTEPFHQFLLLPRTENMWLSNDQCLMGYKALVIGQSHVLSEKRAPSVVHSHTSLSLLDQYGNVDENQEDLPRNKLACFSTCTVLKQNTCIAVLKQHIYIKICLQYCYCIALTCMGNTAIFRRTMASWY